MTAITIIGNLTDAPELRYTPSGVAVAKFTVAVNDRTRNAAGEWQDGTAAFWPVTVWRDVAEHVAESLAKGSRAIVVGRVVAEQWDDKDTGAKRSRLTVTASAVGADLAYATATVKKLARSSGPADPEWDSASSTRPEASGPDWSAEATEPAF